MNAAGVTADGTVPPHLKPKDKTLKSFQSFNTIDAPVGSKWGDGKNKEYDIYGLQMPFCQTLVAPGHRY